MEDWITDLFTLDDISLAVWILSDKLAKTSGHFVLTTRLAEIIRTLENTRELLFKLQEMGDCVHESR